MNRKLLLHVQGASVCTFLCKYEWGDVCARASMWWSTALIVSSCLLPLPQCLRQGLLFYGSAYKTSWPLSFWRFSCLSLSSCDSKSGDIDAAIGPVLCGFWDSNSNPQTWWALFPSEPSAQHSLTLDSARDSGWGQLRSWGPRLPNYHMGKASPKYTKW